MLGDSLLSYYKNNNFNPVPITLEDKSTKELHFARRYNLYQRHLGIPLFLLRGRSVLEFGCNSGENALVLASTGADLTLVEPNEQVLPRLKMLFKKFGFEERIVALLQTDIDSFKSKRLYDVVIVEGFLFTLPNRNAMIQKIGRLLAPGGFAVISFNDRYGSLLEFTRRMIFWRACHLAKINDVESKSSLAIALRLYQQDFVRLNASRPFEAWWKDILINPFFSFSHLWSYAELLPLLEMENCEFYSSSPKWSFMEHFNWYKNIPIQDNYHTLLLEDWKEVFSFFLTGIPPANKKNNPATTEEAIAVSELVMRISEYTTKPHLSIDSLLYPSVLKQYFQRSKDSKLLCFNAEMEKIYNALKCCQLDELISTYHEAKHVRKLWGAPYHYACFRNLGHQSNCEK